MIVTYFTNSEGKRPMDKIKVTILTIAVLLLLIGCSGETQVEEPTAVPPTEVAAVAEPTVVEPTDEPTAVPEPEAVEEPTVEPTEEALPTAEPEPEPEPTEEPVAELVMDNCQTCHSDQEMLTQTADPAVEHAEASESSGVG
jgi:outer membrane biosynthesis protein TonB